MTRLRRAILVSIAVLLSPMMANADLIEFSGDFFATGVISQPSAEISGSWALIFDDEVVLTDAPDAQFFNTPLTAFSMTPDPLGAGGGFGSVSFDESNTLASIVYGATGDFFGVNVSSNVAGNCGSNVPFCPVTFGMFYDAGGSLSSIQWSDGDALLIPTELSGNMVVDAATVPEPGTLALLGIGLLGMGEARRRKT